MTIPSKLDGARVIQHTSNYVTNNFGSVGILNEKNGILEEIPITALAICQYEGSNQYYLFSCNLNWEVIGDFDCETIEDAKDIAKESNNVNFDDWFTA